MVSLPSDRDGVENLVDNQKIKMYSIGTLVNIHTTLDDGSITDVSDKGLIGYIKEAKDMEHFFEYLYRVHVFQYGEDRAVFHNYISPVAEID